MAVGPLLTYGPGAAARAKRLLGIMAAVAVAAAVGAFLLTTNFPLLGSALASSHLRLEGRRGRGGMADASGHPD